MKKAFVMIWLTLLLSAVGALFWYNELVYHLPTPIPPGYKAVGRGTPIKLDWPKGTNPEKPLFLHFFNPDCPCSRFNIANFKFIVDQYSNRVNFAVVVINNDRYSASEIQDKLGLKIPILFDQSIAKACGVYSTPQAVLIDKNHKLYYRGNYNRSRYCTDTRTNYAKIAINGLLHDDTRLIFDKLALRSYGCSLPNCKN
ncbi:MAG: redoxin family protein [Mucilaginibacter sp.]